MMIYTAALRIYGWMIRVAAIFSIRARAFVDGRKGQQLPNLPPARGIRRVWFHVASLGEYYQGRPLIRRWRNDHPQDEILLSFYSPSGYRHFHDQHLVDHVFYLPLDFKAAMRRLIRQLQPTHFILVKYDYWPNLLKTLLDAGVKCYLISGLFVMGHYPFTWYGKGVVGLLRRFSYVFVQDDASEQLLTAKGFDRVMVAGDTRVEDVLFQGGKGKVEKGKVGEVVKVVWEGYKVLVGGSTWGVEEEVLAEMFMGAEHAGMAERWRLILAPHDVSASHLTSIQKKFGNKLLTLSDLESDPASFHQAVKVLLIDRIGLLRQLYQLGDLAVIGGGFGKGIHNILEPAAAGLAVVMGPRTGRFVEARELMADGAAFRAADKIEFLRILENLFSDEEACLLAGNRAAAWIAAQKGSSFLIMSCLQENS